MAEETTPLIVGVPGETFPGERRVALVPAHVPPLKKAGLEVIVESGAGTAAGFPDEQYTARGAELASGRDALFQRAAVILQVRALGANPEAGRDDLGRLREGQCLVSTCEPLSEPGPLKEAAERRASCFSLELVPRITRAQSMDVLSSMATIAGYKAVLLAADALPRMFPMMMTAAGTIAPARVFVVGAGVAGLQAIATARRLGGVVRAYDVRPAVKEQVESLGGKFVELELETKEAETTSGYAREMDEQFLQKQREMMAKVVAESEVVITTAAVPGKRAPVLVTGEMVRGMAPGSVVVDLAAERGGNCELTKAGERTVEKGVTILGPVNLPAEVPYHASEMFSKNVTTFLLNMVEDGKLRFDLDDKIVRDTMVTHQGEVVHSGVRDVLGMAPAATSDVPVSHDTAEKETSEEPKSDQAEPSESETGNNGTSETGED